MRGQRAPAPLCKLGLTDDEPGYGAVNAKKGLFMIILGVILLVLGALLGISILYTVGAILLVVGVVFWILGMVGRPVGGRARYY